MERMVGRKLALLNGKICTMDPAQPWATALAAREGRIIAVGDDERIRQLTGPHWEVIDLRGRLAVPGMIDSHVHLLSFALRLRSIALRDTRSIASAVERVRQEVAYRQPGEWITGGGWDKNIWSDGRPPNKRDLDAVAPENPVALSSKDGHAMWLNSLALERSGLTALADRLGPQLDRLPETDELSGVVKEVAVALANRAVTPPGPEACEEAVRGAVALAQSKGLTSVHTMEGERAFSTLQRLARRGELGLRVLISVPLEGLESARRLGVRSGFGDDILRVGGVKLFADGALGSQTAALLEPYAGSESDKGIMVAGSAELTKLVREAGEGGLGVAIHAIGDAAVRAALEAIEATQAAGAGLRPRIEHAQLVDPADVARFAALGVVASVQPIHATADRDIAERYWGNRCDHAYAYKTLLAAGVTLACGSDAPVESIDPLKGLYAAVTRRREEERDGEAWRPEQCLSLGEALHGYTLGAAYAAGEEGIKGSLERGKLADVVVLSRDIFAGPAEEIRSARVELTVLGGEVVFRGDE